MRIRTINQCILLLVSIHSGLLFVQAQNPIEIPPMVTQADKDAVGFIWQHSGAFEPFSRYMITDQGQIVVALSRKWSAPGFTVYDMETLQECGAFELGRWTTGSKAISKAIYQDLCKFINWDLRPHMEALRKRVSELDAVPPKMEEKKWWQWSKH